MLDRRRHAPSARRLAITPTDRPRTAPGLHRGRAQVGIRSIYENDHAEGPHGGRFRWLISTCLAGAVGAIAILIVIYGSADSIEQSGGIVPSIERMRQASRAARPVPVDDGGLRWSSPKADRLQVTVGALSTRYVIHESLKRKRNGREYIEAKPYVRIVSRLAPASANFADVIPPFNPYRLYGGSQPASSAEEEDAGSARSDVSVKVVELLGGILPGEDGQELDSQEVHDLVERARDITAPSTSRSDGGDGSEAGMSSNTGTAAPAMAGGRIDAAPPNTTLLAKAKSDADDATPEDIEGREVRVIRTSRGDTLEKILVRVGAESWLAKTMVEAAHGVFPESLSTLSAGLEVHVFLVPSLTEQNRMEPVRFSVFGSGHDHRVTVSRNAAGEFVASAAPVEDGSARFGAASASQGGQTTSLYASVYAAGLAQNVPPETIMQILRVHASDTDFRRRTRTGDLIELFFDSRDEGATDGPPGELLYTSITAGGDTSHFYRFRTPDGVVDYYDGQGNNSKKFLMRKPIRGDDVRLTSGFGVRLHPVLNVRKMHTGIDWSAPQGTPILAAGLGVVEEAERKGYNGNYVRIRHANGYHTAYSHMLRFAPGVTSGTKVRQGQLIGYVGTTGLSTGSHLHFEVLINNRFVDPLSIQVPRERQLNGKQLTDFQKERARIDDLMRRAPVLQQNK